MPKPNNLKLITCMLPEHRSLGLIERLHKEFDILRANKSPARGSSYTTDFKWIEMEILEVIVPHDTAETIFAFLYEAAGIGAEHGGMIFQKALSHASDYTLEGAVH